MEAQKAITMAYNISPYRISKMSVNTNEVCPNISAFLSLKANPDGRLVLALEQYLMHAKNINEICYFSYDQTYNFFPNDMLVGSEKKINVSDIDIWLPSYRMSEIRAITEYVYPIGLFDFTFITHKPKYRPQIFGIFQTFSLPVWITMAFFFWRCC